MNIFKKIFSPINTLIMAVTWITVLSILYSTLSIVRHNHFESGGFDLGLYDQTIWLYSKFHIPYNTVKEQLILGDHLNLTLPLIAPVFWIWNDIRAILVLQAAWVAASSFAIYLLALHRKFSPFTSLVLSVIYSLFYGIQYGVFFDFHSVLLGVGLIPWLLYFFETNRRKLLVCTLLLLALTQENMGLAITSLGFIYIWNRKYRSISIGAIVAGIIISLASAKAITLFSQSGFQYTPQITLNPFLFVRELFNAPEKLQVWLYSLSAFSFLPLLSPGAMIATVLDLAQYFTTGPNFARMWSPFMHHRAILAPYLLLGTLEALALFKAKKIHVDLVAAFLLICMIVQQFIFHYPLNKLTKKDFWAREPWMQNNEKMIAKIPPSVRLATQQSLIPHLSHRTDIYLFWPRLHDFPTMPCGQVSCWWLDTNDNAEYLLVDVHPNTWLTMLLETPEHVKLALETMEKLKRITLVEQIGDIALYKLHALR